MKTECLKYSSVTVAFSNNIFIKITFDGFPGGTVVKNPPANAGDTGSSPGPGRSHGATKPVHHNY